MTATLTPQQIAEIRELADTTHYDPKAIWNRLAEMGDKYAQAAAKVINQPDSFAWSVVRGIWHQTGAGFDHFDAVASQHVRQYVDMIGDDRHRGGKLPYTNEIETSYVKALEDNGQKAHTAIDVVVERVIDRFNINPPHWYNTPGVMMLENERVKPSDREILEKIDPDVARSTWALSGMLAAAIRADNTLASMSVDSTGMRIRQFAAGHPHNSDRPTGIHIYINAEKGNWAFYDKAGYGRAHVDGQDYNIDRNNWQKASDGHHHQIKLHGEWKIVQLDAIDTSHTQLAQLPGTHAPEIYLLSQHRNPHIAAFHERVQNESSLAGYSEAERSRIAAAACVECQKAGLDVAGMTELGRHEIQGKVLLSMDDPTADNPYTSGATVDVTAALRTSVQHSLDQMQTVQMAQSPAQEQVQSVAVSSPVIS